MTENNEKKYIIKVRGEEVEVSDEVYRAYVRPIRAEQRRKRREWKCNRISENGGHYVRCKDSCETCPYYQSGNNALGNKLSLDKMAEDGIDLEDAEQDVVNLYIEKETQKEEKEKLYTAISSLTVKQQIVIKKIYFEGKKQEEVAKELNTTQPTVSKNLDRAIKKLKKILKNF